MSEVFFFLSKLTLLFIFALLLCQLGLQLSLIVSQAAVHLLLLLQLLAQLRHSNVQLCTPERTNTGAEFKELQGKKKNQGCVTNQHKVTYQSSPTSSPCSASLCLFPQIVAPSYRSAPGSP